MSFLSPVGKKSPQNPASSVAGPPNYLDAPVVGIETDYARSDHSHGLPAATGGSGTPSATVTGPDAFGDAAVVGVANSFSRGDHNHGLPSLPGSLTPASTVIGPDSFGADPSVGVLTSYARADHDHGLPDLIQNGSTPSAGPFYGAGIGGDTLANTEMTVGSSPQFMRFRAQYSAALTSFVIYKMSDPGYGAGTGGTWKAEIFADDGTANHYPTGSALATQNVAANGVNQVGLKITFASPATLVAGTLYHLVLTNTDGSPASNYFSPNCLFYRLTPTGTSDGRLSPLFPATDWCFAYWTGSSWFVRTGFQPVLGLNYAGGGSQGQSYGEMSLGHVGVINGANNQVRERFTVSGGDKLVSGFLFRVLKLTGSTDLLTVTLEDDSGNAIVTTLVSSSSVAAGAAPDGNDTVQGDGSNAKWVTVALLSPVTLTNGVTYRLRFSCPGTSTYYAWVIRKLSADFPNWTAATSFADGHSEFTTNGVTWSSLGNNANVNDLQFMFTTAGGGGGSSFAIGAAHIISGAGSPAGVAVAGVGSIFLRTDGGAGSTIYVKESGVDANGWVAK